MTAQISPLLRMTAITKHFDGILALNGAELEVMAGEVHALIGENGAGKSTLMKVLAGVHPADDGHITFCGKGIRPKSYAESLKIGICMIFQDPCLFQNLTVAENLYFEGLPRSRFGLLNYQKLLADARRQLDELGFDIPAERRVAELSVAERQLVETAKAVMAGGRLLVMDEPTASLNAHESEILFRLVARLRDRGVSVIYISHRLDEVLRISNRVTVLRNGKTVATHVTQRTDQKEIISEMVGEIPRESSSRKEAQGKNCAPVLQVEKLAVPGKLSETTFELRKGEILGVAGLRGVGQESLVNVLLGIEHSYQGSIHILGKARQIASPADASALGIGYVTDDRKGRGLLLDRNVSFNSTLSAMEKISHGGFLSARLEREIADRQAAGFQISVKNSSFRVKFLSGGNQQKVILARALEPQPEILILNEPTAGIDIGAKREIHDLLLKFAADGKAILLISSDLAELTSLSHRILVLNQKRQSVILDADAANAAIIEAAVI
jgi:ribose transport system ATP-binding protein